MQRSFTSGVVALFIAASIFLIIIPNFAAAEGTVVVFFKGLCLGDTYTCNASQHAFNALNPKLPGTRILTPDLSSGAFPNGAGSFVSSIGTPDKIVLIAYSAGHKAIYQTVNAMSSEQLKRVKTMIALDSNYPSFDNAAQKVRSVNPTVQVVKLNAGQFNTNHAMLPGNSGAADAIAKLVNGEQVNVPDSTTNQPYTQNRPQQPFSFAQAPYPPPITSSMPASYQAPLTSAFSPTAAPSPYTPSITPVSQQLVIPTPEPVLPPPIMSQSLFSTTSITAPKTNTLGAPVATRVIQPPSAPSTFTSGPMTTWSAPLAVFDVRQEMQRALLGLESFLKGLLLRL